MIVQGKNIEVGGGIIYIISTALKMAQLAIHHKNSKGKWVEMPEEEYKKSEDEYKKHKGV